MFTTYILFSQAFSKTYVGFTSDMEGRLTAHNHPQNKGFTRRFQPWVVLHCEIYPTKSEAMVREQFYKSGVGREAIKKLIIEKDW